MTLGGKNLHLESEVKTLSTGHQTTELTELCTLEAKARAHEAYNESYCLNTRMHMSKKIIRITKKSLLQLRKFKGRRKSQTQ